MTLFKNFFLVLIFLLTSCAGSRDRLSRPKESEVLRHQLVEAIRSRNRKISSLRGLATVRFGSKLIGASRETAIRVRLPDRLRVDGLSEFGGTPLVISRGDLLLIQGGVRIPLDAGSVIKILLGIVPVEAEENYRLKKRRGRLLLRGRSGELVVENRENQFLPVRYTAFDGGGGRSSILTWGDYQDTGGVIFPHRLEARFRDPVYRIEVRYRELEVND